MSDRFDDFADLDPAERERLVRVHELLLAADPPPELPPALVRAPEAPPRGLLPRRRRIALALVAAGLAIASFGVGYIAGADESARSAEFVVPMEGTGAARTARASLTVFDRDESGNWPMRLKARGLAPGSYELWLTRGGKRYAPCGRFVVDGPEVEVDLNAPYRFRDRDGWVVAPVGTNEPVLTT